ncbi:hypothetical protein AB0G82_20875 [Streptomyces anulatus]|uniref:hypothetical protein n=1 Tax=Streptomyces anulatus TaxID=1892 RepID=UPI00340E5C60
MPHRCYGAGQRVRRRAAGESVEQIRPDLIIPTGNRKGGPAVIYRALTEHEKRQAYRDVGPTPTCDPSKPSAPDLDQYPGAGTAAVNAGFTATEPLP